MNPSVTDPQDPPKDPLKAVYDDYLSKKLISSAVSIDQFREASDEQLSVLYKQGQDSSIVSMKTDLDTFKSLWSDVKKKIQAHRSHLPHCLWMGRKLLRSHRRYRKGRLQDWTLPNQTQGVT